LQANMEPASVSTPFDSAACRIATRLAHKLY